MNYIKLNALKDVTCPIVLMVYEEDQIYQPIVDQLGYDINTQIDKSYGKINEILTLNKLSSERLIIIGLGSKETISKTKFRQAIGTVLKGKKEEVCIVLEGAVCNHLPLTTIAHDVAYMNGYSGYVASKVNQEQPTLLLHHVACDQDITKELEQGMILAECVNHAREWGNLPANYMTPNDFVVQAQKIAKSCNVRIEVMDKKALQDMGAGAILGVNRGSYHGAYLIALYYENGEDDNYTALVGKGLTFDSGGYNIKTGNHMLGMKYDMCGGANTLATFESIVRHNLKVNVMAIIPVSENRVGENGYTCDEVLTSLSKKTIEITNTDAEGRLILCDAITYAQQQKATTIIDMATLTGACVNALGSRYTGAFTNEEKLWDAFKEASKQSEELVWQLPVDAEFGKEICDSNVADMRNHVPQASAGASLAAAFLQQFIEEGVAWLHLDIAGTSDRSSDTAYAVKGATGVMIETLTNYFQLQSKS